MPQAYFVHFIGNFHICDVRSVVCQATREPVSRTAQWAPTRSSGWEKGQKSWRNEGWSCWDAFLWPSPLAHEVYQKLLALGKRIVVLHSALNEWKIKVQKVSFRKVTLLKLLLWGQTVRGIQRLYILFIVCVCAYSPVWCFLDPEVDAMWSSPEVEKCTPDSKDHGPVASCRLVRCVCVIALCTELYLCIEFSFSHDFSSSLQWHFLGDFTHSALIVTIPRANISQLL